MSQPTKKLLADALKLPVKSRALIAEKLLEGLDEHDGVDVAIEEADKRWQAYKDGKIKGIPIEEVFPNLVSNTKRAKKQ
jgi:putative addiction module component (TIGR02574 family)